MPSVLITGEFCLKAPLVRNSVGNRTVSPLQLLLTPHLPSLECCLLRLPMWTVTEGAPGEQPAKSRARAPLAVAFQFGNRQESAPKNTKFPIFFFCLAESMEKCFNKNKYEEGRLRRKR